MASCLLKWGELSSKSGASCLGASFMWGELSWGELSLGRVVLIPLDCVSLKITDMAIITLEYTRSRHGS